jgi:hypothetical protein
MLCENKLKENITDTYLLNYYNTKCLYYENINLVSKLLNNKFKKHITKFERNEIINKFTHGDISHHTPLNGSYLDYYINIDTDIPKNVYMIYEMLYKKLMNLHSLKDTNF